MNRSIARRETRFCFAIPAATFFFLFAALEVADWIGIAPAQASVPASATIEVVS